MAKTSDLWMGDRIEVAGSRYVITKIFMNLYTDKVITATSLDTSVPHEIKLIVPQGLELETIT